MPAMLDDPKSPVIHRASGAEPFPTALTRDDARQLRVKAAAARLDLAPRPIQTLEQRHPAIGTAGADRLRRRLESPPAIATLDHADLGQVRWVS